jgi:hypothetical protein
VWPEREVDYFPPSIAEVKNTRSLFSLPYAFYGAVLKHYHFVYQYEVNFMASLRVPVLGPRHVAGNRI